jgi:predicted nuclease of predicted toxin-antitoxin system
VIAFLADENFKRQIVSGLLRRNPSIDIIRVQDAGLTGTPDPALLDWAATNRRIVLTHDVQTLVGFAWSRVRTSKPMAGLIVVGRRVPIAAAIEELLLIAECSTAEEWDGLVEFLGSAGD